MEAHDESAEQPPTRLHDREVQSQPLLGGVDAAGELVCATVYKRGAEEVVRRLRG
jgi:hypothetical protein